MCDINGCAAHQSMAPIALADKDRRAFLKGAAALPLATVLFYPELARASAEGMHCLLYTSPSPRDA